LEQPSFSISTINPAVAVGPPVILPSSGSKLNETLRPIYTILSGSSETLPPNIGSGSFVDVRDVAFIHLWAFENPSKADGERYIACGGFGPNQAAADILYERYKGTKVGERIIRGTPGEGYVGFDKEGERVEKVRYLPGKVQISGKKAEREIGVQYISFQKSISDTAEALEKLL
jgi:nucleoside-diphosphate-sugar epimerase